MPTPRRPHNLRPTISTASTSLPATINGKETMMVMPVLVEAAVSLAVSVPQVAGSNRPATVPSASLSASVPKATATAYPTAMAGSVSAPVVFAGANAAATMPAAVSTLVPDMHAPSCDYYHVKSVAAVTGGGPKPPDEFTPV